MLHDFSNLFTYPITLSTNYRLTGSTTYLSVQQYQKTKYEGKKKHEIPTLNQRKRTTKVWTHSALRLGSGSDNCLIKRTSTDRPFPLALHFSFTLPNAHTRTHAQRYKHTKTLPASQPNNRNGSELSRGLAGRAAKRRTSFGISFNNTNPLERAYTHTHTQQYRTRECLVIRKQRFCATADYTRSTLLCTPSSTEQGRTFAKRKSKKRAMLLLLPFRLGCVWSGKVSFNRLIELLAKLVWSETYLFWSPIGTLLLPTLRFYGVTGPARPASFLQVEKSLSVARKPPMLRYRCPFLALAACTRKCEHAAQISSSDQQVARTRPARVLCRSGWCFVFFFFFLLRSYTFEANKTFSFRRSGPVFISFYESSHCVCVCEKRKCRQADTSGRYHSRVCQGRAKQLRRSILSAVAQSARLEQTAAAVVVWLSSCALHGEPTSDGRIDGVGAGSRVIPQRHTEPRPVECRASTGKTGCGTFYHKIGMTHATTVSKPSCVCGGEKDRWGTKRLLLQVEICAKLVRTPLRQSPFGINRL